MTPENDAGAPAAEDPIITEARAAEAADQAAQGGQGEAQPGQEPAAEAEGEHGGEGEAPEAARKPTAQERFDELTRRRRDAERDAEYWKAKALGQDPNQGRRPTPQADDDPEPDPTDTEKYRYGDTDPAFLRDIGAWSARQEFKRLAAQERQHRTASQIDADFATREAAFAKDKPDYHTLVDDDALPITPAMAQAIKTSESGPAVAYHLAKNPAEARRISGLHPLAQARELGIIEARLSGATAAAPPVKPASDAPEPPPQLRGQGGRFKTDPETEDFAAFEKAYGAR